MLLAFKDPCSEAGKTSSGDVKRFIWRIFVDSPAVVQATVCTSTSLLSISMDTKSIELDWEWDLPRSLSQFKREPAHQTQIKLSKLSRVYWIWTTFMSLPLLFKMFVTCTHKMFLEAYFNVNLAVLEKNCQSEVYYTVMFDDRAFKTFKLHSMRQVYDCIFFCFHKHSLMKMYSFSLS